MSVIDINKDETYVMTLLKDYKNEKLLFYLEVT